MKTTVNNTEFTLSQPNSNMATITSEYDETPVSVEYLGEYESRDFRVVITLDDSPYGLIEKFGTEVAGDMISEACENLEAQF